MTSGSQHRGEAGGGGFGFPPLLATDGRIHKGDCDMRTGAIFVRGSCRALKWMALLGVVFALGAGSADAQKLAVSVPDTQEDAGVVSVTVQVDPDGAAADAAFEVTLTLASDGTKAADLQGETGAATADLYGVGSNGPADVSWEGIDRGTASPAALTFAWGDSGTTQSHTVRLRTYRDPDAEDEYFTVTASTNETDGDGNAIPSDSDGFKVTDIQTQNFVLRRLLSTAGDVKMDEGDDETFELEAVPLKTAAVSLRVTLDSANDDSDYSLTTVASDSISELFEIPAASTTGQTGGTVPVPFTTQDNDRDRMDDTVTLTAYWTTPADRRGDEATSLTVTVIDQHKLPSVAIDGITTVVDKKDTPVLPAMTLMEGAVGTVTLVADRGTTTDAVPDSEAITVTLTRADSSTAARADYTLSGSPVSIPAASGKSGKGTFTIDVDADEDVGEEMLTLMATISGDKEYGTDTEMMNLAAITFADNTTKKIEPKSDAIVDAAVATARTVGAGADKRWTASEMLTLMASDLFSWPTTTTAVVLGNVQVSDPKVVNANTTNDNLMVEAVAAGTAKVTVTATVTQEASSAIMQTVSNVAHVEFDITVDAHAIVAMSDAEVQAAVAAAIKEAADKAQSKQWEPGGATAMVALDKLFFVPASITPTYVAESSDMGDVEAGISSDKKYVTLMPKSAGTAMIQVTAVDTPSGGTASVEFDATVMAQSAIAAKTQAEVDKVFMDAGAGHLVAGGDAVMVDMSMLFTIAPGVKPTYTGTSDMPDVLGASNSGMMLTLTPMSDGTAMIMVEAVDSASNSIVPVMYEAKVGAAAITYMLSGPMDMNLAEGMGAKVTVTASGAVAADTEVMLMRDGASSAGMDDFSVTPEMGMIKAGEMMAEFEVMAVEDNMAEDMEMLTLFLVVGDMQMSDQSVSFNLWDAAVPALPVIAQLLLAAFLAVGGYRRYLRR